MRHHFTRFVPLRRDCSIAIRFLLTTAQQVAAPSLLTDVLTPPAYFRPPPFPWIKPLCVFNSALQTQAQRNQ
jgi:hypothetical protein